MRIIPILFFVFILCTIALVSFCTPAFQPKRLYTEERINLLASDAHIVIGEKRLTLPIIALGGYVGRGLSFSLDKERLQRSARTRLETFHSQAANPDTAPTITKTEINVFTYGSDDFDTSIKRICPRLTRKWSKSVCDNPWAPLTKAMPRNRFYLADDRKLDVFRRHWTVGNESMYDQILSMNLVEGQVSKSCDKKSSPGPSTTIFCTAAMPLNRNLIAVWTVWDGKDETSDEQAEREGKAIRSFVVNAIGQTENFDALLTEVCQLKAPNSGNAPNNSYPDPCPQTTQE